MTLTSDVWANIKYRLGQLQDEIDADPDVVMVRCAVAIDAKTHQVRTCYVHIEREFERAAPGVLLSMQLDKPA